jgi:hypothetical protein
VSPSSEDLTLEQCVSWLGYGPGEWEAWLRDEVAASPGYGDQLMSQCRSMEQMSRGLFREELVFGITDRAVYAHDVNELDEPPVGSAQLPAVYGYYYGPVIGVGGSAMGSGGASFEGGGGSAMAAGAGGAAGAAGAGPSDSP